MTDYERQCAWCHADLAAGYIEGPSAFSAGVAPDATRYCSERCVRARIDELFGRRRDWRVPGGEKWVRYCVEVPPEVAATLDEIVRREYGVNVGSFSRAAVTRRALRELLQRVLEVPAPAVTGSAAEAPERRELDRG